VSLDMAEPTFLPGIGVDRVAPPKRSAYESTARKMGRDYMAAQAKDAKDVGEVRRPGDPARRAKACGSLEHHCLSYHSARFGGEMYQDQREQAKELQEAILAGQNKAIAAMRGGGKTELCRAAIEWAILHGHSRYGVLIGATGDDAKNNLMAIKASLDANDVLLEDFPEICVPVRHLDGSSRRQVGQHCGGERTRIEWGMTKVVLPTILPESTEGGWLAEVPNGCGAVLEVRSMDGAIRGRNTYGLRPDLVLVDDAETRESVQSIRQTDDIRTKLDTDVAGLAGHDKALTMILIGTIMDEDAVTSEFTDPARRPNYHGKRYAYLKTWPENRALWDEYVKIRQDNHFGGPRKAKAYYRKNRKAMDKGAVVAWKKGFDKKLYASALEKFWAEWADKRENGLTYVACELQNDPSMMRADNDDRLTILEVCERANGLDRWRIPHEVHILTGFVDVHGSAKHLYWTVAGWDQKFTGWVVGYGTWPEKRTIGEMYQGSVEAQVRAALGDFEKWIMAKNFTTDAGTELVPTFLVDSSWGQTMSQVYDFCRSAPRRNFFPSKGDTEKSGEFNNQGGKDLLRGDNWRQLGKTSEQLKVMGYLFEANYWKRFCLNRLKTPKGDRGALTVFGRDPAGHLEWAKHVLAERPRTIVEKGTGNEYEEFVCPPNRPNHLFDCLVGCAVAANIRGATMNDGPVRVIRRFLRPIRRAAVAA